MEWYHIILIVVISALVLVLLTSYICFRMAFYSKNKPLTEKDYYKLPNDPTFKTFEKEILNDITEVMKYPFKEYKIKSFDGLTLYARYFEYDPNAPMEIMFHGYRGNSTRDLSTGVKRAFICKRNALLVDQRASGKSEGHVISFGIKERLDCLEWAKFACKEFGEDKKIIITGISMGAATVLMASSLDLPKNVIGVLADCGYNKPGDIIKKSNY